MSRGNRHLSADERELWNRIRDTVTPLGKETVEQGIEEWIDSAIASQPDPPRKNPPHPKVPVQPFLPPYKPPMSQPGTRENSAPHLDDTTARKLQKGRIEIDARIDLHGLTEVQAHGRLLEFIRGAQRDGARILLVITGKGRLGNGVLRRVVPLWFTESAFRPLIGGWRPAHLTHGGDGALYVRLRRTVGSRP